MKTIEVTLLIFLIITILQGTQIVCQSFMSNLLKDFEQYKELSKWRK